MKSPVIIGIILATIIIFFLNSMMNSVLGADTNTVNIKRRQQDIEKLITDVEKLKDKVRQNGGH